MNEVYKYCKFCNETKNINDFCKSGMFVKNICRECWNKKTRERYKNSKLVEEKDKEIERLNNIINKLEKVADARMNTILDIERYCVDEKEDLISGCEVCEDILKIIDKLKGDGSNEKN